METDDSIIDNELEAAEIQLLELRLEHQLGIANALREDLQEGYNREYDLHERLEAANEMILALAEDNAKLTKELKIRGLQ